MVLKSAQSKLIRNATAKKIKIWFDSKQAESKTKTQPTYSFSYTYNLVKKINIS